MARRLSQLGLNADHLVGACPALLRVLEDARRVAPHEDIPVLILGENGTGKEEVARYIHSGSSRAAKPMVVVNCAAIPKELFESELFGHERGAFTGAVGARRGAFEQADGATLFLDEVGDLVVEHQAKLLRALQQREIRRVGAEAVRRVDVRVIAATNRDLWQLVKEGCFREDFYFRLAGWRLTLPPLRERGVDILAIARVALQRDGFAGKPLSRGAARLLLDYKWPGNIRELINAVTAAAVRATGPEITASDVVPSLVEMATPRRKRATADAASRSSGGAGTRRRATARAADVARSLSKEHGEFSATDLGEALGVKVSQRKRLLQGLLSAGVIQQRGVSRARRYYATS